MENKDPMSIEIKTEDSTRKGTFDGLRRNVADQRPYEELNNTVFSARPQINSFGSEITDRVLLHGSDLRRSECSSMACSSEESRESSIELSHSDTTDNIHSTNQSLRRRRLNSLLEQQPIRVSWTKYLKQNLGSGEGRERLWRDTLRCAFGIQPRNSPLGIEGSKMIDPFSPFHGGLFQLRVCC
jgi:hypothetical protein